ncbi:hypothetical protein GCM10023187_16220 [Nibrella viscosa]|uniref:histidine kinase n=1 Tax=Nibrella viscosa TaxID=1084524 RepID=A0ABP8K7U8_9BACT
MRFSDTEQERLNALAGYHILDSLSEEAYDTITQLASQLCETPVSLITFLDDQRQWFKSVYGFSVRQTHREHSFCTHAILHPDQIMEVPDARIDKRFAHNPLTLGDPPVIFYAGVPLVDQSGHALGTLCVIDHRPRQLSARQITALKGLARQVESLLTLRRTKLLLEKANQQLQEKNGMLQAIVSHGYGDLVTNHAQWQLAEDELIQRSRQLRVFFDSSLDLHCITDTRGVIMQLNRSWETMLGYSTAEVQKQSILTFLHPDDVAATQAAIQGALDRKRADKLINRIRAKDGTYRLIEWHAVLDGNLFYTSARNITEASETALKLRTANERLELATRAAKQGIWEYEIDSEKLTLDQRLYEILGDLSEDTILCFADLLTYIYPDDHESLVHIKTVLENGAESVESEFRIVRPDAAIRYVQTKGIIVGGNDGNPQRAVGVAWDVTERKEAELVLHQRTMQYLALVDNLKEVVFQTDLAGNWTFLNPYWSTLIGFTVEESLGRPFYRHLSPRYQVQVYRLFRELLSHRMSSFRHIILYQHKNGDHRWAEVFVQLVATDDGRPVGTTGTITDITERKVTLDALYESNQLFQEFAANIDKVIFIHSATTFDLLYINPAFERVFGLSTEQLYRDPNSSFRLVLDEDKPAASQALMRYQDGEPSVVEYRIRKPDGSIRWISSRTFVIRTRIGKPMRYIGIASDITDQKEKELVLQQSLAREQELNRMKSQFVATASHEFRTPMATIQSSLDLIRLHLERSTQGVLPAINRHLGIIEREITNFSELMADILTIGKIDAGKISCSLRPVDVQALVKEVVATHFGERNDNRNVEIGVSGIPQAVCLDTKLITHVLINLLANAFKFSQNNPELHLTFGRELSVAVIDRGIGIPAEDMPHLFETFFRAGNVVNIQGSGLGLIIVRQFIELHGGSLHIDSVEGRGTTVTFTLPIESERPAEPLEP